MKKILFLLTLMISVAISANAQTVTENGKLFDNTYVGLSIGGEMSMNHIRVFKDKTFPSGNLYIGKWLTPTFALEINGEAIFHNDFKTNPNLLDGAYIGLAGVVNLNNLLFGYKSQPRTFEFMTVTGLGWLYSYGKPKLYNVNSLSFPNPYDNLVEKVGRQAMATKMGIRAVANLGKEKSTQLFLQPSVMYILGGVKNDASINFNKNNGRVGVELGLVYKLPYKNTKGKKVHNFTSVPVPYYSQDEYDVRERDTIINEVIKEVEVTKEVVKEKVVTKYVVRPTFLQGKSKLDATSKNMLKEFANYIKDGNEKYRVEGYASVDGDETYNQKLSEKRAETVMKVLVENGVDESRLTAVGKGETEQFGSNYEDNRIVIVVED